MTPLTTIRLPIRHLPDQFDRREIITALEDIEGALMDDGVYGCAYANSVAITIEVPTNQLIDAANALRDMGLIS